MFAVIKTGGKQYKVANGDKITIERLVGEAGQTVFFSEILMLGNGAEVTIGAPLVVGAGVEATIVLQARGPKVISFKKRRRQNSMRKRGHRQNLSVVEITNIIASGAKAPTATAAVKAVSAAAPKAAAGKLDSTNLSLISGIGPTIEKKLRAAGVTTWEQIASWSDADVAKWDEELALRNRATREEWVEQAKELLAGKAPRAKADQAELKSGQDW